LCKNLGGNFSSTVQKEISMMQQQKEEWGTDQSCMIPTRPRS
jgi:hypothetical protein